MVRRAASPASRTAARARRGERAWRVTPGIEQAAYRRGGRFRAGSLRPLCMTTTTDGRRVTGFCRWRASVLSLQPRGVGRRRGGRDLALQRLMTLTQKEIERLFRVPAKGRIRLKDFDPGVGGAQGVPPAGERRVQGARQRASDEEPGSAQRRAGSALGHRPPLRARRAAGDGRRGQGRSDQARDERRQSAGLPGVLLQEAVG